MAPDKRTYGPGPYLRGIAPAGPLARTGRVRALPPAEHFVPCEVDLSGPVTFLVGENGAGKSTLLEAIAVAAGFDVQGGTLGDELGGRRPTPPDAQRADELGLELTRRRPRSGFFLRAESFFNIAGAIDDGGLEAVYGGRRMHEQSHGESFVALATNRFGGEGLFLLDEPEAALSVPSALAFIEVVHSSAAAGSQYVIATHSPILLAVPGARILEVTRDGVTEVGYDDTDPVRLHRAFLEAPERFLRHLELPDA